MRRLSPLIALLLTACGEKVPAPGSGSPPEGSTSPIQGSLTVRTHYADRPDWRERYQSVYVLLGDGSRFRRAVDDQGMARFEDPTLVGAQDVTIVEVQKGGAQVVHTLLAMDVPELELPYGPGAAPDQTVATKQATLTGKVTGATGTGTVSPLVVGEGFYGLSASNPPPGTFSFDIWGYAPGRISLFASESMPNGGRVLRVGMKKDIVVGGGQPVTDQEVVLDHVVDQTLAVTVEGMEPHGTRANASLLYFEGTQELFGTGTQGTPPLSLPAIARTAPFDTAQMNVSVGVGDEDELPRGGASTSVRVGATSPVNIKLLAPVLLASPTLGTRTSPGTAPRNGFVFRWSADPTARFVKLVLMPVSGSTSRPLIWEVLAPTSVTTFTPFPLPAEAAPQSTLEAGLYAMEAQSLDYGEGHGVPDYIQYSINPDLTREQRKTEVQGYVTLQ
ncbi:hypothetical protein JRI60_51385 [Archangium violaceum]|uniref:hypothetical protein n=1 Tax=Archangium violaceum TaxID=83451 RepID=UPI00194F96EA|nr:hypothetical protein [Archangium violaceum]QRN97260.1 hypothetical protein JRI60_51385 [Archangium violaceum]